MVQVRKIAVEPLPQPVAKRLLAEGAVAFPTVFVGKMPQQKRRMVLITLRRAAGAGRRETKVFRTARFFSFWMLIILL